MLVQQFQKPQHKRQKTKVQKNPPLFELGYCWGCYRTQGLERHHIYGSNPDRQHSERYGLYVDLCHECHLSVTNEKDKGLISRLKQEGQRRFEQTNSRDEFYKIFGRYYI
jgi:hypothetical protein